MPGDERGTIRSDRALAGFDPEAGRRAGWSAEMLEPPAIRELDELIATYEADGPADPME
jgi:hypothetical protein